MNWLRPIANPILLEYGIRMTRKQKEKFRSFILHKYPEARVEKSILGKNIVIGDVEKADTLVVAHYDTPPRLPKWFMKHITFWVFLGIPVIFYLLFNFLMRLPETLLSLSFDQQIFYYYAVAWSFAGLSILYLLHLFGFTKLANLVNYNDNSSGVITALALWKTHGSSNFAVVLVDNEEKLLLGSFAFARKYKKILDKKTIIVLDCIGQGKNANLYYCKKPTKISKWADGYFKIRAEKNIGSTMTSLLKRTNLFSMSDHVPFAKYNHVLVLTDDEETKALTKIHTIDDNEIDYNNIYIIHKMLCYHIGAVYTL